MNNRSVTGTRKYLCVCNNWPVDITSDYNCIAYTQYRGTSVPGQCWSLRGHVLSLDAPRGQDGVSLAMAWRQVLGLGLGLGDQVLGLDLGLEDQVLGLGLELEGQVLGLGQCVLGSNTVPVYRRHVT